MPLRLREYHKEDFDELWQLDQQCFPPGIAYSRFELMRFIRQRSAFTLVVEDGEHTICGFAIGECRAVKSRPAGHVVTIDVREQCRRGGVGNLLMDALEARVHQTGNEVVYLETAVDNSSAIAFYKRRGYAVLSTIPRYYLGKLDALLMGKKL
jgi:ribosomal-protein-alanine N-acetyltransferase